MPEQKIDDSESKLGIYHKAIREVLWWGVIYLTVMIVITAIQRHL